MHKGPFTAEWLARSSHETPQAGTRLSPTRLPWGAQLLPSSAAGTSGPRKGTPARRGSNPGRRSPGKHAAAEESGPSGAARLEEAGAGEEGSGSDSAQPGRPRTKFSASQLQELERSFREQRYIGASEKRRLSRVLKLSQTQIKTWFQNRRMKFKRQTQDARVEALFSGLLVPYHYPEIQTPSYSIGMELSISSTAAAAVTCSLHPAIPTPALLLPPTATPPLQPVVPTSALLVPAAPALSYPPTIPTVSLTPDHNQLRLQPYLPPS